MTLTEPSRRHSAALYFCLFTSGASGLIYEVLWAKHLALFVGSTAMAQIIVLATFMGGLAVGGHVFGRVADRVASPLKLYAMIELGIGLFALVGFTPLFAAGREIFIALARATGLATGGLLAAKALACVLIIAPPSILIGGTLPALARHMVRSVAGIGPKISRLYFLNSLGAVLGCLAAGFYLISSFGLRFTMIVGGLLNVAVGLVALAMAASEADAPPAAAPAPKLANESDGNESPALSPRAVTLLLACVGLSGAVSMMYEVAWIRLLTLVLGSSTYSFSLMLATFILGLSLGGLALSIWRRPTGYRLIFGLAEVGVGLSVLIMLPFYVRLPYIFNQIESSFVRERATFPLYQGSKFLLCAMVMIVPTILQGITLPAATKVLTRELGRLGGRIGFIFAINTVGTLVGVVFAGFIGLPMLGVKGTLELAVLLNLLLGIAVLTTAVKSPARVQSLRLATAASILVGIVYVFASGGWDREVFSAGIYRVRQRIPSFSAMRAKAAERETIWYRDGVDATIAIQEVAAPESGVPEPDRLLVINGKVDGSLRGDLPTQKMLAHLPMLVHPEPKNVLIIGLGTGAVVGSALAHGPEHIDVVEISRDVIDAAPYFAEINGSFWDRPEVDVHWEDAKTFLQITDRKYDVIISEPTNPWIAGVAGVFSREFFETCAERLAPGGMFVQWIQAYELEDPTFYMMLGTFTGVFGHYSLWNPYASDTILVGSPAPYGPDLGRMRSRVAEPAIRADLAALGIDSLLPILGMQMADRSRWPSHVAWLDLVHSDLFPILDYAAPRGFYLGSKALGVRWLDERGRAPALSSLWVRDYLSGYAPERTEFADAHEFANRFGSHLFEGLSESWVRAWADRFPGDAEARIAALIEQVDLEPTELSDVDLGEPASPAWRFRLAKRHVEAMREDYVARRSVVSSSGAEALAATLRQTMDDYPDTGDPDLVAWFGEAIADLGRHGEAAAYLGQAALWYDQRGAEPSRRIENATHLVRSLLALGDLDRARSAYDTFVAPIGDTLEVRLVRGLITQYAQAPPRDFTQAAAGDPSDN